MIYFCCDPRRRNVLEAQSIYNGIDFLEVDDDQRTLRVRFVHPLSPGQLTLKNVRIEGGERLRNVQIEEVRGGIDSSPVDDARILFVRVTEPGDFSTYTLCLVDTVDDKQPPPHFDPILSCTDFSFKVSCPSDFDCQGARECPPEPSAPVDFTYLAKDYASFRQLMLDRMSTLIPQWQERNPADFGIVLVELLAYIGDYLSYQQDAVATEAYLRTARRRTSVRRHARLVDYMMHDGRNARTWVHFTVRADIHGLPLTAGSKTLPTQILTAVNLTQVLLPAGSQEYRQAKSESPQAFELMEGVNLYAEHNRISLYTWGSRECCLPKGATTAFLRGPLPGLKVGDVLVFQEVLGPNTGVPADADPAHRHAVRLTKLTTTSDPLGGQFDVPANSNPVSVTAIEWFGADALPFPLCVSSRAGTEYFEDVSVALGNIALADHGFTITAETLPEVPAGNLLTLVAAKSEDPCNRVPLQPQPARYRPVLQQPPLTFADPYDRAAAAGSALSDRPLEKLIPAILLTDPADPNSWQPMRDLLRAKSDSQAFVAEADEDGSASLRFGDGVFGKRPPPGTLFSARYRIGNGTAGNMGTGSLRHLASDDPAIVSDLSDPVIVAVTNPMPAKGGLDPESLEEVRQRAPYAFRSQQRAVTAQDYQDRALLCDSSLQQAHATFRWTGSWRTVFVAADRKNAAEVDQTFQSSLKQCLERYRMAGHDLEVQAPVYVSLEMEMTVCVMPEYFASQVEVAVLAVLNKAFDPDNFTFGQTVYLGRIVALVQATPGVDSVAIVKFQRQGIPSKAALDSGKMMLQPTEIVRLENDRNFPERGSVKLTMHGGL
ncbi:MAG TPA: putative baseplate assembly protein [Bryobacteraceae bacterium]|nr:putative baseplate assembly protein [Bryobacteraceae bacterium]